MFSFYKKLLQPISSQHKQEFLQKKIIDNNLKILCLSAFLTIEQMYYGLYIVESGTLIQEIHFSTAIIMFIYAIISTYIQVKKPICTSWIYQTYEISFGLYGFLIAVMRSLLIQNTLFPLPTIYIAVIYGFSVFFYFHPFKSFFIYGITSALLIVALPIFKPTIIKVSYIPDTLSNNMIAWIASVVNYQKYAKDFINEKIIAENNQKLKENAIQIHQINKKLKDISTKDGLTNIYNRRKSDEILKHEYLKAKKYNQQFSVILLDLDLFKSVNDTYGHNVGDKVLVETAEILKNNIRNNDMVFRWGGEEFLIVCPNTNRNEALSLSEKLRKKIEIHRFSIANKRTSSFGVATYKEYDTIENLIARADQGLYQAKKNGRNRVEAV